MGSSLLVREKETMLTGEEALAWGAHLAGINFIAAVASFPGNEFVNCLRRIGNFPGENLAWYSTGKSAIEAAYGAAIAGRRAAVALRGTELGSTLDLLGAIPLPDKRCPLLLFCLDDPGAWFTHNESDCRALCTAIRIPVLEPCNMVSAFSLPTLALKWSLHYNLPILLRYCTSFSQETNQQIEIQIPPGEFKRKIHRWQESLSLPPKDVLERRIVWEHRLERLARDFSNSGINKIFGGGHIGILCSGYLAKKALDLIDLNTNSICIAALETIYPLPREWLQNFLGGIERLLVLEEGEPVVEREVRSLAHQSNLHLPISGKLDDTVAMSGEILRWQLEDIFSQWYPSFQSSSIFFPYQEQKDLSLPDGFCQFSVYEGFFHTIAGILQEQFQDKKPVVVANPDCASRLLQKQGLPIQVSMTPGSSIGIAAGIASLKRGVPVIALLGDSAFYHSGLNALIDAIYHRINLIVLIFNNLMSAASGMQPNPGSGVNAKNRRTEVVAIPDLLLGLPVQFYDLSLEDMDAFRDAITDALPKEGVRVLHIKTVI